MPGYQRQPVYRAAQAVQHSADGYAYSQYQPVATLLAADFTGRSAHAVWCWPDGADPARANLTAARRALTATFGPVRLGAADPRPGDAPACWCTPRMRSWAGRSPPGW